jgi:hypothetical protein
METRLDLSPKWPIVTQLLGEPQILKWYAIVCVCHQTLLKVRVRMVIL